MGGEDGGPTLHRSSEVSQGVPWCVEGAYIWRSWGQGKIL